MYLYVKNRMSKNVNAEPMWTILVYALVWAAVGQRRNHKLSQLVIVRLIYRYVFIEFQFQIAITNRNSVQLLVRCSVNLCIDYTILRMGFVKIVMFIFCMVFLNTLSTFFFIVLVGLEYDGPIEECLIAPEYRVLCGDSTDSEACLADGCC